MENINEGDYASLYGPHNNKNPLERIIMEEDRISLLRLSNLEYLKVSVLLLQPYSRTGGNLIYSKPWTLKQWLKRQAVVQCRLTRYTRLSLPALD